MSFSHWLSAYAVMITELGGVFVVRFMFAWVKPVMRLSF
jgi:hypothetical protein